MRDIDLRLSESEAAEVKRWAEVLGVDGSELLRDALQHYLAQSPTSTWRAAHRRTWPQFTSISAGALSATYALSAQWIGGAW